MRSGRSRLGNRPLTALTQGKWLALRSVQDGPGRLPAGDSHCHSTHRALSAEGRGPQIPLPTGQVADRRFSGSHRLEEPLTRNERHAPHRAPLHPAPTQSRRPALPSPGKKDGTVEVLFEQGTSQRLQVTTARLMAARTDQASPQSRSFHQPSADLD